MENELIKVTVKNDQQLVSARDLHKGLELTTRFNKWVKQNFADFIQGDDFSPVTTVTQQNQYGGTKEIQDYALTLDMAKQLCMMSHTELGKKYRKYFIELERKWNDPQEIVKRGYAILQNENTQLKIELGEEHKGRLVAEQRVNELTPKASYYDLVLQNKTLVTITQIAKDYGMSGQELNRKLHELGVIYRQGNVWLLYSKYQRTGWTQSETFMAPKADGTQKTVMHTKWTQKGRLGLYALLKQNGILPLIEMED